MLLLPVLDQHLSREGNYFPGQRREPFIFLLRSQIAFFLLRREFLLLKVQSTLDFTKSLKNKINLTRVHCCCLVTPWTVAHKTLLSMRCSRQEYRSGLPFVSPGDLPDPGVKSGSPALAGGLFAHRAIRESFLLRFS